jgi:sugar phosphate permease
MGGFSYRWYVVAAAAVTYMLVIGTTFSSFALFVLPVSTELGLKRADMNTALILINIGGAVMAPFMGRMLDRFSPRRIMMISSIIMGLSLAALGLSHSIWLSAAVLGLPLAVSFQGAGALSMAVFIARWFETGRGRAIALAMTGMSFGAILVAPAVGLLITELGWRTALVVMGAVTGTVLTLISFTMRDGPESAGAAKDGRPRAAPAAPIKVGALLRTPLFWMIALPVALTLGMSTAISISIVPLGQGNGLTVLQATSLISAMGIAGIVGKLLLVAVDSKVERSLTLVVLFGAAILVDAALLFSDTYMTLLGCAVALGVALGAVTPAYLALLADRFGAATFGTAQGLVGLAIAVLGVLAVRLAGEVFDRTGGYDLLFAGFLAIQVVAAGIMLASRFIRPTAVEPATA